MYSTTARVVATASPGHSPTLTSTDAPFFDTLGTAVFRVRPMTCGRQQGPIAGNGAPGAVTSASIVDIRRPFILSAADDAVAAYLIVSSLFSALLLGRLLVCDDQTTSQTLLPVFTGCE